MAYLDFECRLPTASCRSAVHCVPRFKTLAVIGGEFAAANCPFRLGVFPHGLPLQDALLHRHNIVLGAPCRGHACFVICFIVKEKPVKRFLALVVLLSALAIGCTPAPQPSTGDSGSDYGSGSGSSNTTVSNTTNE